MKDKVVRDIMVPLKEYPYIPETHTLRQAIQAMGRATILMKKRTSLPRTALVFDEGLTELLGILRRRDIMRGLEPKFMTSESLDYQAKLFDVAIDPNLPELSFDKTIARMRQRADHLVRDYMLPIRATINANDHIMKAIYEMVTQNVSLLPVIDEDTVLGVVRSVDVLYEIALIIAEE
ncbi:MAG: CBS domain-containing protein [Planctomycetota bacterium]|jgi:CBS domain-containing protein